MADGSAADATSDLVGDARDTVADSNVTINKPVFGMSVGLLLLLVTPLALYPDEGRYLLGVAFDYLTHTFGVVYILMGVFALAFLLYIAFSRHGRIVFGKAGETAEFSMLSWSAMLFCGGIGTSVLYWGTVEWAHYFNAPPFGVEPRSAEALRWAVSYPLFHWGFIGWAFYCLPGVAMGYMYYVRGTDSLRLSQACRPAIPARFHPVSDVIVDLIFVVGLIGACSTGFGLGVPLIGTLSSHLLGLDVDRLGFTLDVFVIVTVTAIFCASAWLGLDRGIKRLSNLNVLLALLLMLFILALGPTRFILELGVEGIGHLLANFVTMSTWTDPQGQGNFVETWTVFYWAWWLALGPFMGLFIARISRGRTIREVILGCLGYGTLGCMFFFVAFGNYAAHLQLTGVEDVLGTLGDAGASAAILLVLKTLPLADLIIFIFAVVCVIFAATSYDSASYTLAIVATDGLGEQADPGRGHRVFWSILLGALPITLIYMGGLKPLQSAVTLASVPLLFIFAIMAWVLWRELHKAPPSA